MAHIFSIDATLLNQHLSGACKDSSRRVLHNTVMMQAHDGVIDVVSCDGRILMHTKLTCKAAGCVDGTTFGEIVLRVPSGKVSARRGECAIVTIDGGNSTIATSKGVLMPEVESGSFPAAWRDLLLPEDAKPASSAMWFNPKYLMLVYNYMKQERGSYTAPQVNDNHTVAMWTLRSEQEIRRAVLAALRC